MSGRFEIDMSASCHIEHKASATHACWMFLREWRREAQDVTGFGDIEIARRFASAQELVLLDAR